MNRLIEIIAIQKPEHTSRHFTGGGK